MTHPVLNLVRKDLFLLMISKKLLLLFVTSMLLFPMFSNDIFREFIYIFPPILFATICFIWVTSDYEIILNTLPVKRSDIIKAGYLSYFLFMIIGLLIISLAGFLFQFILTTIITFRLINWFDIWAVFISGSLFLAVFSPVNFKFTGEKTALLLYLPLFFIFLGASYVTAILSIQHLSNKQSDWLLPYMTVSFDFLNWSMILGLSLLILILLFCSILLSLKIYQKRDL
ncbi:MAG: ABC-2 transporter permease [Desulfotomaculum sp.]|nr:ABC-2 transporter permease [Desulfotomaculum sp.]